MKAKSGSLKPEAMVKTYIINKSRANQYYDPEDNHWKHITCCIISEVAPPHFSHLALNTIQNSIKELIPRMHIHLFSPSPLSSVNLNITSIKTSLTPSGRVFLVYFLHSVLLHLYCVITLSFFHNTRKSS